MCWNKEVSIITYITVMVLVIILYKRNIGADRHIAIFSAAFVIIQLLEFFAWLSIENKNRKMNDFVTRLILIALWAQPLINTSMARLNVKSVMMTIGIILSLVLLFQAIMTATRSGEFKTSKGKNCHLVWSRKQNGETRYSGDNGFMHDQPYMMALYLAGLFIPLLFIKPFSRGIKLAAIGAVLLAVSRAFSSKREFSSWWCWAAGIFTLSAIFIKK